MLLNDEGKALMKNVRQFKEWFTDDTVGIFKEILVKEGHVAEQDSGNTKH